MTAADRDRLRAVQDRWLSQVIVQQQLRRYGEDTAIAGLPQSPTFRDVRTTLLPEWEGWFNEFFEQT